MPPRESRESNSLLTIVKAQIVFLLSTLTEDNFERNQSEIRSVRRRSRLPAHLFFILARFITSPNPYSALHVLAFRHSWS
jgi:CCR4-NOT transcription complex subunit 1